MHPHGVSPVASDDGLRHHAHCPETRVIPLHRAQWVTAVSARQTGYQAMLALLIRGESRTIEAVDVKGLADIERLVGFHTLMADNVGDTHEVYFDEDCFLRKSRGRFQIDRLPPIAGNAVVIGTQSNGTLTDASLQVSQLQERVKFL